MGKKSAKKDRGYQTASEWAAEGGGFKRNAAGASAAPARHKTLPFTHCGKTAEPWEDPVCTPDGAIFDLAAAVPHVRAHGTHPLLGTPLALGDLTRLRFEPGPEAGTYACPVLGTRFTPASHIVAVKKTGRVYSWEAVEKLNIAARNWADLVDGTPFGGRGGLIVLQDPTGRVAAAGVGAPAPAPVAAAKPGAAAPAAGTAPAPSTGPVVGGRALAAAAAAAAAQKKPDPRLQPPPRLAPGALASFKPGTSTWNTDEGAGGDKAGGPGGAKKGGAAAGGGFDPHGGRPCPRPYEGPDAVASGRVAVQALRTAGTAARGLTSTIPVSAPSGPGGDVVTAPVHHRPPPTAKAHARLHTSAGDLNLELHAGLAPRAVENFLTLAASGYYDATPFHRSVRHFMVQGGDPTGTGKGGESIYGPTFPDEVDPRLTHSGRGVLGMASAGKDGGGSQFYITYRSAPHLNGKHTVFGRVVGGWAALDAMEAGATDKDDRPVEPVILERVTVYDDPFAAAAAAADPRVKAAAAAAAAAEGAERKAWFSAPGGGGGGGGGGGDGGGQELQGVGRYLRAPAPAPAAAAAATAAAAPQPPPAKKARAADPFDNW